MHPKIKEEEEKKMANCKKPHDKVDTKYCSECGEVINQRRTPLEGCEKLHDGLRKSGCSFCGECGEQLLPICYEGKECPSHLDAPESFLGFTRKYRCLTCNKEFELSRLS